MKEFDMKELSATINPEEKYFEGMDRFNQKVDEMIEYYSQYGRSEKDVLVMIESYFNAKEKKNSKISIIFYILYVFSIVSIIIRVFGYDIDIIYSNWILGIIVNIISFVKLLKINNESFRSKFCLNIIENRIKNMV